jgi:GNAT superfamily N-acetyltransferase
MDVMPQLPVLTTELALRIERFVAPEVSSPHLPADPAAPCVVQFGRTVASKAKGIWPANKVFCFGHDDVGRLHDILAFYAADHLEPTFHLAPMEFSNDVAGVLHGAGFVHRAFEQAIMYGVPAPRSCPLPDGITIERVTAANLEEFVQATADGFEWHASWRDEAMEAVRTSVRPAVQHFLVRVCGTPAGVGSLGIRENVASLGGGAIVPAFRGRGCHLALVHHRVHVAHAIGCELVLGGAAYGSGSFRNQQRAGLRIAYVESTWSRRPVAMIGV